MITSTGWSCGASLAAACGFGDGFVLLALKLMRSFDCGVLIWVGWVWFAFEDGVGAIGRKENAESSRFSFGLRGERERPRKLYGDDKSTCRYRERRDKRDER